MRALSADVGAFSGLRDAHLHLAEYGEELGAVDLSACRSRGECLDVLRRAAGQTPAGQWIKGVGARAEAWSESGDGRWPTAEELGAAVGGRQAIVLSFDHHALVASSAALAAAGIDARTPEPPKGVIERGRGGVPTGLLLEEAAWLVVRAIAPASDEAYEGFVRRALADLAGRGFVEVHDMLSTPRLARVLLELERREALSMRVWLYGTRPAFDELHGMSLEWESRLVRLAGLKIFTDGTLNSRTAHMLHPFADPLPGLERGKAMMSGGEIEASLLHAAGLGFPVAAHAIGDAAVRSVLDAIERTGLGAGASGSGIVGQRVEHAQFVDEADIERFAELGVVASMQPCHLLTDMEAIERLVPGRAGRSFPVRELIASAERAGQAAWELVWLGSDAPVVPPRPEDTLQAAVERRRAGMDRSRAIGMDQSVSREAALSCLRAAWWTGQGAHGGAGERSR